MLETSSSAKASQKDSEKVFLVRENSKIWSEETKTHFSIQKISLLTFTFDCEVTKAFYALVYNGVRVAILWDSYKQCYVGMLTITDFIMILDHFYKNDDGKMKKLEEHKIRTWRDELMKDTKALVYISPEQTLLDAVKLLLTHKVHRLPVIDSISGNTLHILTHKRLLKYLHLHMNQLPTPTFMYKKLVDLPQLGTRDNISVVKTTTKIHDALQLFMTQRVSALPVVDEENCLVDIYAKFDVINLAATRTYDQLDISVYDALGYRRPHFSGVETCKLENTFGEIVDQIVEAGVHRLVVVDEKHHILGIVSLSDILRFLIQLQD